MEMPPTPPPVTYPADQLGAAGVITPEVMLENMQQVEPPPSVVNEAYYDYCLRAINESGDNSLVLASMLSREAAEQVFGQHVKNYMENMVIDSSFIPLITQLSNELSSRDIVGQWYFYGTDASGIEFDREFKSSDAQGMIDFINSTIQSGGMVTGMNLLYNRPAPNIDAYADGSYSEGILTFTLTFDSYAGEAEVEAQIDFGMGDALPATITSQTTTPASFTVSTWEWVGTEDGEMMFNQYESADNTPTFANG